MASTVATYPGIPERAPSIPRLCRALIGDWIDVREKQPGAEIGLHVTLKAHGDSVLGSVHVRSRKKWLRMKVTPGWFCALGSVFERRGDAFVHVAKVRLCHRKRERSLLLQVMGRDDSGALPHEAVLWRNH